MEEELKHYGLSDKETRLYLANLKAGDSTANRLSELTGIRRSTVYEVIENLKKKGVVASYRKDKKLFFTAEKPEKLIERLKEKEESIRRILPDLHALMQTVPEKPAVQLYEGLAGMKNAVEDMLSAAEILVYGASNTGDPVFGHYIPNFAKKRAEKHIKMRAVIEPDVPAHMTEKDVGNITEIRTLPFLKNHNSVYFIYNDKLLVMTLGHELIALSIRSTLLATSQRQLFEFLWEAAK